MVAQTRNQRRKTLQVANVGQVDANNNTFPPVDPNNNIIVTPATLDKLDLGNGEIIKKGDVACIKHDSCHDTPVEVQTIYEGK